MAYATSARAFAELLCQEECREYHASYDAMRSDGLCSGYSLHREFFDAQASAGLPIAIAGAADLDWLPLLRQHDRPLIIDRCITPLARYAQLLPQADLVKTDLRED